MSSLEGQQGVVELGFTRRWFKEDRAHDRIQKPFPTRLVVDLAILTSANRVSP